MYDDDDDDKEPFLLVLGVLAAVIGVVLLVFLRGESVIDKLPAAAPEPVEEIEEPEPEVEEVAAPDFAWVAAPAIGAIGLDSAAVSFASNAESSYTFDYEGADGSGGSEAGGPATDHSFDLSGLTPGTEYNWTSTITDEEGHTLTDSGSFTTAAPDLTPTDVTIALGDQIVLTGTVPDEDTKNEIGSTAIAQYGDDAVVNNLVVDGGYTNDGGTIRVTGAVATDAAQADAGAAFDGLGLSVDNEVDVSGDLLVADLNALFQLEPIQFDSGSANIRGESIPTLDEAAELLLANSAANVSIEGHTDDQGPDDFNLALSTDRAQAVLDYLADKGVEASRMNAVGFGEANPIGDNATDEGRQQNRRIEFKLA